MTALRPVLRRQGAAAVLDDSARAGLQRLLDADPVVNAVVAARVRAAGSLSPGLLGGPMIGVHEGADLTAACFSGGNLLTIGGDPDAWPALAEFVSARPRSCSSIVGRAEAIAAMWPILQRRWGPARAVRAAQPLLVLDRPVLLPGDGEVRPAQLHHLDRYLPAAAAMFAEELGVSPHVAPGAASFEARVRDLIADGRAFASFDFRGQVVFKAEIGAVSEHTSQIQGVWVRPDLRGRGIGTAALATVFRHALTLAPTVSLYVNDFNEPARRVYQRLGMQHIATLSTVLLP